MHPHPKIKILVTGFGPCYDSQNISEDVVRQLQVTYPGVEVTTCVLTSEYRKAEAQLAHAIKQVKPDFVISLGERNKWDEPGMAVESIANSDASQADRTMQSPASLHAHDDKTRIRSENPLLNAFLDERFCHYFPERDGVKRSNYAGGFICEDIFYCALKHQAAAGHPGQAMFLHLDDLTLKATRETLEAAARKQDPKAVVDDKTVGEVYAARRHDLVMRYSAMVSDMIDYIGAHPKECKAATRYLTEEIRDIALPELDDNPPHFNAAQKPGFFPLLDLPFLPGHRMPFEHTDEVRTPWGPYKQAISEARGKGPEKK